jgi:hypothetical protein|tara:strand:+ start:630 stop:842 length:213 start_codon:yes stop_codon:yes gene_type:complete
MKIKYGIFTTIEIEIHEAMMLHAALTPLEEGSSVAHDMYVTLSKFLSEMRETLHPAEYERCLEEASLPTS